MIDWKKRPEGGMELSMPCEGGRDGDRLEIEVDPLAPVTRLGPQATVSITEQGAGSDPDDGRPCEAVATITLTAAGLRRLAAACSEAADELDRTGAALEAEDRTEPAPGYVVGLPGSRPWTMRGGTCCCSYCVGAYDHQPEAPDHRAALAGCVGTGWHAHCGPYPYPFEEEPPLCTADAAVLAGGER